METIYLIIGAILAIIGFFLYQKRECYIYVNQKNPIREIEQYMKALIENTFDSIYKIMPIKGQFLHYRYCCIENGVLKIKCGNLLGLIFVWLTLIYLNSLGIDLEIFPLVKPSASYVSWFQNPINHGALLMNLQKSNQDLGVSFWESKVINDGDSYGFEIKVDLIDSHLIDLSYGWLDLGAGFIHFTKLT